MKTHRLPVRSLTKVLRRHYLLSACILGLIGSATASGETKIVDKHCDYHKIPVNTAYKNDCSPVIFEDNFIGIKINAPGKVRVSQSGGQFKEKETLIPIAGYYNVSLADLVKDPKIQLIVENTQSGKRYSGTLFDHNNTKLMADRASHYGGKKLQEQSFGAYLNPNITKYVALPNTSAEYNVSLVMGKFESNTVKIKIDTEGDTLTDW